MFYGLDQNPVIDRVGVVAEFGNVVDWWRIPGAFPLAFKLWPWILEGLAIRAKLTENQNFAISKNFVV